MQHLSLDPEVIFLCSFYISSPFTNISPKEAVQIGAHTLYNSEFVLPTILEALFNEILIVAFTSVEVSFNNIMRKQINGVAVGSPLAPPLANMFVEYYKEKLFRQISKPAPYFRNTDDTFVILNKKY